jgi:hypothetical protein
MTIHRNSNNSSTTLTATILSQESIVQATPTPSAVPTGFSITPDTANEADFGSAMTIRVDTVSAGPPGPIATFTVTNPGDYFTNPADQGPITVFADGGGGQVVVTSNNHDMANATAVIISGTTSYNGTFTTSNVTTNTFEITDTWVADDATGTWNTVLAVTGPGNDDATFTMASLSYRIHHDTQQNMTIHRNSNNSSTTLTATLG